MNIREYGVKKSWDNKWQTFANAQDGKYLMPITWLRYTSKHKTNAQEWLRKELKKLGVNYDKK